MCKLSVREDAWSCDAEKPEFTKDAVMSEYSDIFGEELDHMEGKVHLESDPNVAPTVMLLRRVPVALIRASDISRKKKQNFAGFSGANSQKNRPISRGKSQNSRKNQPISRDFRGRKVKICRKIVRFRGIFFGKFR